MSANAMVTFKGKSFVLELLNVSLYSSWTSSCMVLIVRVVIHSNQGAFLVTQCFKVHGFC